MFQLEFAITNKKRNSTKLVDDFSASVPVNLKPNSSVMRPTFVMRAEKGGMGTADEIILYNYCRCEAFGRYYYITDVIAQTAVIFEIHCVVDVLATYREEIFNTEAFVMFAENRYNSFIRDFRIPMTGATTDNIVKVPFDFSVPVAGGCFIVTVATTDSSGDTGAAQAYALSKAQMMQLAEKLYTEDFWQSIANYYAKPQDFILSCIWIPVATTAIGGTSATFELPGDISISGVLIPPRTIEKNYEIHPHIPHMSRYLVGDTWKYSWADYRNLEPYSEYKLWLPHLGSVPIPMDEFFGTGYGDTEPYFTIKMLFSPMTGDISYNITRVMDVKGASAISDTAFMTLNNNCSVSIPLVASSKGVAQFLSVMGQTMLSLTTGVAATALGMEGAALNSIANSVGSYVHGVGEAMKNHTFVRGTVGGWTETDNMSTFIEAHTIVHELAESPEQIQTTIGRPLYQFGLIGNFKGLIKVQGAFVECSATEEEHTMIAQFVNSSTNYIFGGLIVE